MKDGSPKKSGGLRVKPYVKEIARILRGLLETADPAFKDEMERIATLHAVKATASHVAAYKRMRDEAESGGRKDRHKRLPEPMEGKLRTFVNCEQISECLAELAGDRFWDSTEGIAALKRLVQLRELREQKKPFFRIHEMTYWTVVMWAYPHEDYCPIPLAFWCREARVTFLQAFAGTEETVTGYGNLVERQAELEKAHGLVNADFFLVKKAVVNGKSIKLVWVDQ